jgi:hypothetical protein
MPSLGIFRERQTRLSHYRQTLHSASDATRSRHVSSSLQKPTVMNSSDRRVLRFWPQRPSRRITHSSKLYFMKSINRRVWCSAPPRLSPPPLQVEARVDRQTRLSPPCGRVCCPRGRVCRPPRPRLSHSMAASVTPVVTSVAPRGRVCRSPWPRLSQRLS